MPGRHAEIPNACRLLMIHWNAGVDPDPMEPKDALRI